MEWDPGRYSRYAGERGRPFIDLIGRIGAVNPRRVIDLGCGPGNPTALLAERWPAAAITGVDSSPQMIAHARPYATERLGFTIADIADYPVAADVVISNATLHWVPTHRELLQRWSSALPADGWLAFQVPGNFDAPSHMLMRELAESPRWRRQLGGVLRHSRIVDTPAQYAELLLCRGLAVDAWESTYLHPLGGLNPVLEWVRGTALRPVLAALSAADVPAFEAEYAALLRSAYPVGEYGTIFAFRRIFCVAHKLAG